MLPNCNFAHSEEVKQYFLTTNCSFSFSGTNKIQTMNDDSCDSSFGDDHFNTDKTFERRYTNKKKIKEYLQKWKGYSCMNDVSKLEDLEYDSIVLDYNVQKKNKDATSSKLQKSQLGASGSSYVKRSTYTIPCHYLADKAKPIHRKTKEIKQPVYPKKTVDKKNVSDTSNEVLASNGSGIEKECVHESVVPTSVMVSLCQLCLGEKNETSNK
uniref:Bm10120, isoform b n=1 Tax=Brugia malayi TaxID=6279 RepID=A0A1I9G6X5_BRUMA|nr:Bm10120, isoform b [Brugia malayi]